MTHQKPKPHIMILNGQWDFWRMAKSDGRTTRHPNPSQAAQRWCNARNIAEGRLPL